MNCYGFKGGVGHRLAAGRRGRVRHVHGGRVPAVQLRLAARADVIAGVPLGAALADDDPLGDLDRLAPGGGIGDRHRRHRRAAPARPVQGAGAAGAARPGAHRHHRARTSPATSSWPSRPPIPARSRLASRRSGRPQGDTGTLRFLQWRQMDALYQATVDAVEEAVLNALCANEEMTGRLGHRTPALPRERVAEIMARRVSPAAG